MTYKINKNAKYSRILGENFVKNNAGNCKLLINNKEYDLCKYILYDKSGINKNDDSFTITLTKIKTEKITDLSYMFYGCDSLTSLNLQSFNTNNINNMEYMFYYCYSLTTLNLSSFNTQNVTKMLEMFRGCSSLMILNLSLFNTKNVTDMYSMFSGCFSLVSLNLSLFDAEKANIESMFKYCYNLCSCGSSDRKIVEEYKKI